MTMPQDALDPWYGIPQRVEKPTAGGSAMPTDYISGLLLTWNSTTSISLGVGSAVIESTGNELVVSSPITLSGLSLSASTWYHAYLSDGPTLELSTTGPATAYKGTARSKTGDTSRRYMGSILTVSAGAISRFQTAIVGNVLQLHWLVSSNVAPWRLLSGGTATTVTNISASSMLPTEAVSHLVLGCVVGGSGACDFAFGVGGALDSGATFPELCGEIYMRLAMSTSQPFFYMPPAVIKRVPGSSNIQYMTRINTGSGSSLYVDMRGLWFTR